MTQINQVVPGFNGLGITPELLAALSRLRFTSPTPIQHQCIPAALEGKDIVGIAQTGTGKTLAFGIPMIQLLGQNNGQGLILLPTRELALQVNEVLHKIGQKFGLRTAVLIGGASSYQQIQAIRRHPHILVSTPGRLIDHLQRKNLSLEKVKIIVLDEADRMFDIGFIPQIKQILNLAPEERQMLMFS
ncbi:DEAD/DEAH box helicase, partial [Candidatus Falkowbacteria bacterium CG11_big_fil_rev_8_21_14_0_20_39_10]